MARLHLLIVSKNALFREGLAHLLSTDSIAVVGEFGSLEDASSFLRAADQNTDLVAFDLNENAAVNFLALKTLKGDFPRLGVIVLAGSITTADFDMAIESGVHALLPRDISADALHLSLRLIALGENLFAAPPSVSKSRMPSDKHGTAAKETVLRTPLSPRERQILSCVEKGASNKVIARDLVMAEATVKVHIKSVLRKIEVSNRTQAAIWSMNHQEFKDQ